jgi:RHS repeat-associated protein
MGSTIAWSNTTGASLGTQAYDPYGQPQAWSGPRYAYTGQLMIGEAQLYDYKARAYAPGLGRFMQTDPAGYVSDLNPYAYAANDPLDFSDPSGLDGDTDCGIIGGLCLSGLTITPGTPTLEELTITPETLTWDNLEFLNDPVVSSDGATNLSGLIIIGHKPPLILPPIRLRLSLPNIRIAACKAAQQLAQWSSNDSGVAKKAAIVAIVASGRKTLPIAEAAFAIGKVFGATSVVERVLAGVTAGAATGKWGYLTFAAAAQGGSAASANRDTAGGPLSGSVGDLAHSIGDDLVDAVGERVAPNPCRN